MPDWALLKDLGERHLIRPESHRPRLLVGSPCLISRAFSNEIGPFRVFSHVLASVDSLRCSSLLRVTSASNAPS